MVEEVDFSPSPKFGGVPDLDVSQNPQGSTPNVQEPASPVPSKAEEEPLPNNTVRALPAAPLSLPHLAKKKYDTSTVL